MNKYIITAIGLIFFCGTGCQAQKVTANQVCFHKTCFNVEVVSNFPERMKGLQHRESLPEDAGMLFIFQRSFPYTFWMKDTLIPLDMIWMDYSRKIVHIEHNVPPCEKDPCPHYGSKNKSLYVLEINAGKSAELGLKVGNVADFKLILDQ